MPDRTITYLSSVFGVLVGSYLVLVVGTVLLASYETDLIHSVGDTEAKIGVLESRYYDAVATLTSTPAAAMGLIRPEKTAYVRAASVPVLTRAGN